MLTQTELEDKGYFFRFDEGVEWWHPHCDGCSDCYHECDTVAAAVLAANQHFSLFTTIPMQESKGPSWWAFLTGYEDYSLAVSEVSPEDAIAKARSMLADHGWREEMGAEVGILLCKQYERGRMEDVEAEKRRPIECSLNDQIRVKLEAWARDEYLKRLRDIGCPEEHVKLDEDEDGFSVWPIWSFMHEFGKYMVMGSLRQVCPMRVTIERVA